MAPRTRLRPWWLAFRRNGTSRARLSPFMASWPSPPSSWSCSVCFSMGADPIQAPPAGARSANAELLRGHLRALHPVGDLLPSGLAGEVWGSVVGFLVDAERRESAVIGRAELFPRDEVGRADQ